MKKKLEAELISIAHRILKLKNRAELDQLQQETLKLYEKISVLRFVEDNFSDIKPTIGYVSVEEVLEDVYGLEEERVVHVNEVEVKEEAAKTEKKSKGKSEEPEAEEKQREEVKEEMEESAVKIEIEKPAKELKEVEEAVIAVFEKEEQSMIEEEEKATDAEAEANVKTKVEESELSFSLAFENKSASEEPAEQKEITFEDYKDYKEPEFVKKVDLDTPKKAEVPRGEENKEQEVEKAPAVRDWRDWEPTKSEELKHEEIKVEESVKEELKVEVPKEELKKELKKELKEESSVRGNIVSRTDFERPKSLNDSLGKSISLGLNDRIAFEKNLFGGSTDDLNRVLSQLNTINTFDEAKDFISELVKPDYNEWKGKEEYEERFMEIVEKKFS